MTRTVLRSSVIIVVGALFLCAPFSPVIADKKIAQNPSALRVIVTPKPLHSITAFLMKGRGSAPQLLFEKQTGPHEGILRPKEWEKLNRAQLIIWIGPQFQPCLHKSLKSFPPVKLLSLLQNPKIGFLHLRHGDNWESCEHRHSYQKGIPFWDGHIWLDPLKMISVARVITRVLKTRDPDGSPVYDHNLKKLEKNLYSLHQKIKLLMDKKQKRPFFVLHDAYQYFEKRYQLQAQGAIFLSPDLPLSAKRLSTLTRQLKSMPQACVVLEPQFQSHRFLKLFERLGVRTCVLDPLGSHIPAGADAYVKLMQNFAQKMSSCLQ